MTTNARQQCFLCTRWTLQKHLKIQTFRFGESDSDQKICIQCYRELRKADDSLNIKLIETEEEDRIDAQTQDS
jgi:hypothetical protein